jgi:hypothetical protein
VLFWDMMKKDVNGTSLILSLAVTGDEFPHSIGQENGL